MLIGQTIATSSTGGETYFTPWFPRQGNDCVSVVEVIALGLNAQLVVTMQSKNSEDTDATIANNGDITVTSAKADSFACTNAKELCRYRVQLQLTTGSTTSFCHFRMLSPSWETTGAQSI